MTEEGDLFAYPPSGTALGKRDTSAAAAEKIHPRTRPVRARIMELMGTGVALTADEIAAKLGLKLRSVRPRVTELFNAGKLKETRARRRNRDGNPQIVWTKAEEEI